MTTRTMTTRLRMKTKTALIVLGFMLAGCGGGADDEALPEPEATGSVAESITEPMERAKAVEDQAMEHKDAIDEAVEDAEAEDPPAD
jgi:hypothetical protein